ncbi:MAG TPA: hypothetical protein VK112_02075 [Fodinibius sp.]|nr:hypothetical protein [Fodinibius sp.]
MSKITDYNPNNSKHTKAPGSKPVYDTWNDCNGKRQRQTTAQYIDKGTFSQYALIIDG